MGNVINIRYYDDFEPYCYWSWMTNPSRHPNMEDSEELEEEDGLGTGNYLVYMSGNWDH